MHVLKFLFLLSCYAHGTYADPDESYVDDGYEVAMIPGGHVPTTNNARLLSVAVVNLTVTNPMIISLEQSYNEVPESAVNSFSNHTLEVLQLSYDNDTIVEYAINDYGSVEAALQQATEDCGFNVTLSTVSIYKRLKDYVGHVSYYYVFYQGARAIFNYLYRTDNSDHWKCHPLYDGANSIRIASYGRLCRVCLYENDVCSPAAYEGGTVFPG